MDGVVSHQRCMESSDALAEVVTSVASKASLGRLTVSLDEVSPWRATVGSAVPNGV